MKNLHVLTTENQSRLRYNIITKIWELNEFPKYHTDIKSTHNIYITSDEEIKMQDWCITAKGNLLQMIEGDTALGFALLGCKKIILTTDQELIVDGIEQISENVLLKIVEHINFGKNIESFDLTEAYDDKELGRRLVYDGKIDVEDLIEYTDIRRLGKEYAEDKNMKHTSYGYLKQERDLIDYIEQDNEEEFE